ncbi:MAG TPA: hypothetical protein VFQ53_00545 [Kofleriaceae bacterium]|nr:hypothetical protein [Kofleriaceae bacterium]
MRRIAILLVTVMAFGCGKSAEEQAKEDVEAEMAKRGETVKSGESKESAKPAPDEPKPEKAVDAAVPEPTTPAEIDAARKQAMIDGRDKDVVKYCEMAKIDDKSDPQAKLGCALAACRINDADKAKSWAHGLPKPLMEQAIKTCMANKVVL